MSAGLVGWSARIGRGPVGVRGGVEHPRGHRLRCAGHARPSSWPPRCRRGSPARPRCRRSSAPPAPRTSWTRIRVQSCMGVPSLHGGSRIGPFQGPHSRPLPWPPACSASRSPVTSPARWSASPAGSPWRSGPDRGSQGVSEHPAEGAARSRCHMRRRREPLGIPTDVSHRDDQSLGSAIVPLYQGAAPRHIVARRVVVWS